MVKMYPRLAQERFQFGNLAADAGFNHLEQPAEQAAFEVHASRFQELGS